MCGKFLVANSYGLLYRGLDRGHVKFLELKKKTSQLAILWILFLLKK